MNNVNLIGRWVREHEQSTVGQQNTTLVKNTIAVDHPFKKESPSFLRVVMWGKTGELANQYTSKGSQIAIEGHLESGSYDDKDGKKVFTVDVVARSIKFLDSKNAPSNQSQGTQQQEDTYTQNQQQSNQNRTQENQGPQYGQSDDPFNQSGPIHVSDDDLPF